MLAERRSRVQYVLNPRNHSWSADKDNFGKKLMERMGWSKGKGLGRDEQGATEHIRVTYKNDNKGMGYTGPVDDPVLHQNDFNELLSQLNQQQEPLPIKPESLSSLEKRSESTRRRVHYKKFTRGKDLSRYSAKDLECIVGSGIKKKIKEEPPVEQETERTGDQGHSHGVETISGGLMADYFRKKMIERGLMKPKVESKEEENEKDQEFAFVGFKMEEDQEAGVPEKKERKKKNKSKKKKGDEIAENDKKNEIVKDEIAEEPDFAFVGFKMCEEQVEQPEDIKTKNKKKKKRVKSENVKEAMPEEIKIEPEVSQQKPKKKKLKKRKIAQECLDNDLNTETECDTIKKKRKNAD